MAYNLNEINERCRTDAAGFIAECDAVYADRLEKAADRIQANLEHSPIVLLSGPSGSGKTTTAMKICEVLESRGIRTHSVSLDDYFKTVSPETTPRTASGAYDLESPLCLDMDLLNEHFTKLTRGERIYVPKYDFVHQARLMRYGRTLRLKKDEVVVFEGIHALNDAITTVHPEAFKLYISARSNILDDSGRIMFKGTWMRLMRRRTGQTCAGARSSTSPRSRTKPICSSTPPSPMRCPCSTTPPRSFSPACPRTRRGIRSCAPSCPPLSSSRTSPRIFWPRILC